jgi:hypothetical protein
MTTTTGDRLLGDYLARLDAAALHLPPDRRAELMEGIAEHIAAARASGELRDEAAVRTLLDRLGEPEEIVAAASEDTYGGPPPSWRAPAAAPLVPRQPGTALELAAVLMLTIGSLLPVVGWLVGVALLWSSRRWRTGEKLLGTLVVPGGPGGALWLSGLTSGSEMCTTTVIGPGEGFTFEVPGEPPLVPPPAEPPSAPPAPPQGVQETTVCESTGGLLPVDDLPGWASIAVVVLTLVAPLVVAVVLLQRARGRAAAEPPVLRPVGGSAWGGVEIAAVVLLAVGSFVVPVLGPVVGLGLAWASQQWTTADKAVATALLVAPLALVVLVWASALLGVAVGFGPIGGGLLVLVLFFGVGPLLAAGYLALALSRR